LTDHFPSISENLYTAWSWGGSTMKTDEEQDAFFLLTGGTAICIS